MRTPKISYPKCVSTMLKSADMPERTITIKNKNGKDSIQSEFVGLHAKRETPMEFMYNIISDIGNLIDRLTQK